MLDFTMLDSEKQKKLYEEAQLKYKKRHVSQTAGDHQTGHSIFNQSANGGK